MTPSDSRLPTPDSHLLEGLRVLVTRPANRAEGLGRLIARAGGEPIILPLLAIEPTARPAQAARQLADARGAQWWIFTSANAVQHARALDDAPWPEGLAAVGSATAAAVEAAAQKPALAPESGSSGEALLQRPEFQHLNGQRVAIVTGADGLEWLPGELAVRGATVEIIEVYRRVPLPHPPEAVESAIRRARAIVLTSGEALTQLVALAPESAQALLRKRQLVVPSERVVEMAAAAGFGLLPLVPEQMSDPALVRCLESWWKAQANR